MSLDQQEAVPASSDDLVSSTRILNLPQGVYAFTVRDSEVQTAAPAELILPAMQVGVAPMRSAASVEFMTGASSMERWLAYNSDMIVVKISGAEASLSLTSVRRPDSPALAVDVSRLTAESHASASSGSNDGKGGIVANQSVRLLAHIKNIGDLHFVDCWAGWIGQKLPIEAFAILAAGQLPAGSIEYCGINGDGFQTPWLGHPSLCGSRGLSKPLLGFAIRLRPALSGRFDCSYSGRFLSGATVGPLHQGAFCRSSLAGDFLEGIDLCVTEKAAHEVLEPVPV